MIDSKSLALVCATTCMIAATGADAGIITECAFVYDVQIEETTSTTIENRLAGVASIDLPSFIELFPPVDRLSAAKLFTDCLSKHFASSDGGSVVNLEERTSLLPDVVKTLPQNVDFALRLGEAIRFQDGSSMSIARTRHNGQTPVTTIGKENGTSSVQFSIGDQARTSDSCKVRFLSKRALDNDRFAYTFDYSCD